MSLPHAETWHRSSSVTRRTRGLPRPVAGSTSSTATSSPATVQASQCPSSNHRRSSVLDGSREWTSPRRPLWFCRPASRRSWLPRNSTVVAAARAAVFGSPPWISGPMSWRRGRCSIGGATAELRAAARSFGCLCARAVRRQLSHHARHGILRCVPLRRLSLGHAESAENYPATTREVRFCASWVAPRCMVMHQLVAVSRFAYFRPLSLFARFAVEIAGSCLSEQQSP